MKQAKSVEAWMDQAMVERATKGKYMLFKGIFALILKLSSVNLMVFLRYKLGTRFISIGTIRWVFSLHLIVFFIMASLNADAVSIRLLFYMALLFIPVAIWRVLESRWNLYRRNAQVRHGADMGRSYLWRLLSFFLRRIGFNEWRFQFWIEPLLIFVIGGWIEACGFGFYLQLCAIGCFLYQLQLYRNYHHVKQKMMDSKILSQAVQEESRQRTSNIDRSPPIFKRSLRDKPELENWKANNLI